MTRSITVDEYVHSGGSKSYHVIALLDEDHDAEFHLSGKVIRRWGKIGTVGQFKFGELTSSLDARRGADREGLNRLKKDYELKESVNVGSPGSVHADLSKGLRDKVWASDPHILNTMGEWLAEGDAVTPSYPPEEPEEEVDRGELWGSW